MELVDGNDTRTLGGEGAYVDRVGLKGLARGNLEPTRKTSLLLLLSLRNLDEKLFFFNCYYFK